MDMNCCKSCLDIYKDVIDNIKMDIKMEESFKVMYDYRAPLSLRGNLIITIRSILLSELEFWAVKM